MKWWATRIPLHFLPFCLTVERKEEREKEGEKIPKDFARARVTPTVFRCNSGAKASYNTSQSPRSNRIQCSNEPTEEQKRTDLTLEFDCFKGVGRVTEMVGSNKVNKTSWASAEKLQRSFYSTAVREKLDLRWFYDMDKNSKTFFVRWIIRRFVHLRWHLWDR